MESDTPRTDEKAWTTRTQFEVVNASLSRQLERELNATKAQLVSRADELAAAIAERDGYLEGNRQTLRALNEANEIAARYKKERDDARREVCRHMSMRSAVLGVHRTSKEHAIALGWDCYAPEGGGA